MMMLTNAGDGGGVSREVAPLRETQQLARAGTGVVFWATARQTPRLMDLIGREREVTFRAAGEGTGQARDLDVFDDRYIHLCAWDLQHDELIGAYRLGVLDATGGGLHALDLLYTSTLFHFDRGLTARLSPAIELGRAFVRAPYQRRHAALMLLWMGIGNFVARQPRTRHLFGAVSIGATYSPAARALMVAFLKRHALHAPFARQTMARNPIPAFGSRLLELTGEGVRAAAPLVPAAPDVDALDAQVRALDREGKGVPVLLRQYLRLGARVLAFNIDRGFGDALDALVVVDLRGRQSACCAATWDAMRRVPTWRVIRSPRRSRTPQGREKEARRVIVCGQVHCRRECRLRRSGVNAAAKARTPAG